MVTFNSNSPEFVSFKKNIWKYTFLPTKSVVSHISLFLVSWFETHKPVITCYSLSRKEYFQRKQKSYVYRLLLSISRSTKTSLWETSIFFKNEVSWCWLHAIFVCASRPLVSKQTKLRFFFHLKKKESCKNCLDQEIWEFFYKIYGPFVEQNLRQIAEKKLSLRETLYDATDDDDAPPLSTIFLWNKRSILCIGAFPAQQLLWQVVKPNDISDI